MSCETTTALSRSASSGCTAAHENVFACKRSYMLSSDNDQYVRILQ